MEKHGKDVFGRGGDANNETGNSKTTWEYENDHDDLFVYKASTHKACSFDSGISLLILNGGKSHSLSKMESDTPKALLLLVRLLFYAVSGLFV